MIEIVGRAPGCVSVQLLVGHEAAESLVIVETWQDVAAHAAAARLIPAEQLALVRPLLAGPPRGRYYEPA